MIKHLTAGLTALVAAATMLFLVGGARAAGTPRAQLRGFACHNALDPGNRSVSLTAVMRPVPQTKHLAVRFDLYAAKGRGAPTAIHVGDLGTWIRPANPTLGQLPGDVWNLRKQVVPLDAPASYRFAVQFRWLGAHNRILESTERLSPRCLQSELRPDLTVESIAVSALPGHPQQQRYTAVIANQGNSAAGPFSVLFSPGDSSGTSTHTVVLLGAHGTSAVDFVGPLCTAGTAPTVTADSALQVHDSNRANNALTATCPAHAGG